MTTTTTTTTTTTNATTMTTMTTTTTMTPITPMPTMPPMPTMSTQQQIAQTMQTVHTAQSIQSIQSIQTLQTLLQTTLSPATVKGLGDKLYEKRKLAALEVEQAARNALDKQHILAQDEACYHTCIIIHHSHSLISQAIGKLITKVNEDFLKSSQQNLRKGGMMALAAIALGCGKVIIDCLVLNLVYSGNGKIPRTPHSSLD